MKKLYFLFCAMVILILPLQAQITVDVDPDATILGYMVVTNLPAPDGDGAYQFEGGWGVSDLVMEVTPGTNLVLKPNRINDPAPYWQTGGLQGNKWMNASGFVEVNEEGGPGPFTGQEITFQGNISAFTLNNSGLTQPFLVEAFIKRFAAGVSALIEEVRIPLTGTGNFSLTSTNTGGVIFQYGFTVTGPNINNDPAFDTGYANLGSVVAVPYVLDSDDFAKTEFNVSPNPSNNVWNIKSQQTIESIYVFDVLGKQVMNVKPNKSDVELNSNTLPKGLYFAKMTTEYGANTIKLIKN